MDGAKTAFESFRRDAAFRMLAHSCVAQALDDDTCQLEEFTRNDVYDIALKVAAVLLERVFTEDAALNMMRTERDHYRELAERCLISMPPPQTILKLDDPHHSPAKPTSSPIIEG